jgi:hypothetical protein
MKKFVLLLLATSIFWSCSKEDNNPKFHLEILPVQSITLPLEFNKDEVYEIPVSYSRPSNCHAFEGFYYDRKLNIRTIAIQTSVLEQSNCELALQNPIEAILRFKPTTETSYIFKIWKGKDINGANIFEEITVPVVP